MLRFRRPPFTFLSHSVETPSVLRRELRTLYTPRVEVLLPPLDMAKLVVSSRLSQPFSVCVWGWLAPGP